MYIISEKWKIGVYVHVYIRILTTDVMMLNVILLFTYSKYPGRYFTTFNPAILLEAQNKALT